MAICCTHYRGMRESNLQVNLPKQEHIHTKSCTHTVNPLKGICTKAKALALKKKLQWRISVYLHSRSASSYSFHPTQLPLRVAQLSFQTPLKSCEKKKQGGTIKTFVFSFLLLFFEKETALCFYEKQKDRKLLQWCEVKISLLLKAVWRHDHCWSVRCTVSSSSILLSDPWHFVSLSQGPLNQCSMRYLCLQSLFTWQ